MCGAAAASGSPSGVYAGLSPRVWGSREPTHELQLQPGSIPTCVGQPGARLRLLLPSQVYPHVCGAAWRKASAAAAQSGLSPRVWGSPTPFYERYTLARSIPTCVGQPRICTHIAAHAWVYPHVCGAALCGLSLLEVLSGLSPRVWGSPTVYPNTRLVRRSIPTCVGQPNGP